MTKYIKQVQYTINPETDLQVFKIGIKEISDWCIAYHINIIFLGWVDSHHRKSLGFFSRTPRYLVCRIPDSAQRAFFIMQFPSQPANPELELIRLD